MPVLNFPISKEKNAHVQQAAISKNHDRATDNAALTQALSFVETHNQTVLENLIARACHAYLAERGNL